MGYKAVCVVEHPSGNADELAAPPRRQWWWSISTPGMHAGALVTQAKHRQPPESSKLSCSPAASR